MTVQALMSSIIMCNLKVYLFQCTCTIIEQWTNLNTNSLVLSYCILCSHKWKTRNLSRFQVQWKMSKPKSALVNMHNALAYTLRTPGQTWLDAGQTWPVFRTPMGPRPFSTLSGSLWLYFDLNFASVCSISGSLSDTDSGPYRNRKWSGHTGPDPGQFWSNVVEV